MSKYNYITDEFNAIALQGIRTASKKDQSVFGTETYRYYIEVEYKGLHKEFYYPNPTQRDETFAKLCEALHP